MREGEKEKGRKKSEVGGGDMLLLIIDCRLVRREEKKITLNTKMKMK